MQLMPGETALAQLAEVALTNCRVQCEISRWGEKKLTTIGLDDLTSCDIESHSKPIWLALGIPVTLIAGFLVSEMAVVIVGVLVSTAAWFFSRRKVMVLRSASEKIEVSRSIFGESWNELQEFTHQVQMAKADRATASRAGSMLTALGGQQARSSVASPVTATAEVEQHTAVPAEHVEPATKPKANAQFAALGNIWTGHSSFTFGPEALASAPATPAKSPVVDAAPIGRETAADAKNSGPAGAALSGTSSEQAVVSTEIAGSSESTPASPTPEEQQPAPADISSEDATTVTTAAKPPKAYRSATLAVSVAITAVVVSVVVAVIISRGNRPESVSTTAQSFGPNEVLSLATQSVVAIDAIDEAGSTKGSGSGFVVDDNGSIVTNYHLIRGASTAKATAHDGGTTEIVGVAGYSRNLDFAILRVGRSLPALRLGDSDRLQAGARVFSVCSSGSQLRVTEGIITGINRTNAVFQTSAPTESAWPCPVFDVAGSVIGFTGALSSGTPGAVLINTIKKYAGRSKTTSVAELTNQNTVVTPIVTSVVKVAALQHSDWPFEVDDSRMANAELGGSFTSTGGFGGQVRVIVRDQNQNVYDSGRTTSGNVRLQLSPGKYTLVLDNSVSLVFARDVTTDFCLRFVQ